MNAHRALLTAACWELGRCRWTRKPWGSGELEAKVKLEVKMKFSEERNLLTMNFPVASHDKVYHRSRKSGWRGEPQRRQKAEPCGNVFGECWVEQIGSLFCGHSRPQVYEFRDPENAQLLSLWPGRTMFYSWNLGARSQTEIRRKDEVHICFGVLPRTSLKFSVWKAWRFPQSILPQNDTS